MRRILALILSLTLGLSGSAALAQSAADTTEAVTTIGNVNSLFVLEDALYALSWRGLYRFDAADQNPVSVPSDINPMDISRMTAYGDTLFAMDRDRIVSSFTLTANGLGEQKPIGQLPLPQGEEIYCFCNGLVADGEAVWVLMTIEGMNQHFRENVLYRVDRASGEVVQTEIRSLTDLCAYKDGLLLARQEADQARIEDDGSPKLVSIDKGSLSVTTLCTLPEANLSAPAYDAANDRIYLASPAALYRMDSAYQIEKCALLSLRYVMDGAAALMRNDRYLVPSHDEPLGFIASETDPSLLPTQTLKIGMTYLDNVTRDFANAHPEIALELMENFYTTQSMAEVMLTASGEIDVYSIYLGNGSIAPLRDKGYYVDLSQSSILADTVSRMYPKFSAHCYSRDGQLFALPYAVQVRSMGYSPSGLKALGLTEDALPSTYLELLDFLVDWVETNGYEDNDLPLFEGVYDIRQQLYYLIERVYISSFLQSDEPFTYDTPLFRSLLEGLDKATPVIEELNQPEADLSGYTVTYESGSAPSLFTMDHFVQPYQYNFGDYLPLLLTLDENTAPVLECTQQVLLINPYSENLENALLYLEYMAQHLESYQAIAMFPDNNEPIGDEQYQQDYDHYSEAIADLKERLEAADEASKKPLEDELENMQLWLEELENRRWAFSAEKIAAYRQMVPLAVLNTEDFSSPNMMSLSSRYLQGELSIDAYIAEMERSLRMMRLEDE